MAGVPPAVHKFQFSDASGVPLASGTVDVYLAGTTTRSDSWQDTAQATLNTNPIVLDSTGSCTIILANNLTYKLEVRNAAGVVQSHLGGDNISGAEVVDQIRTDLAASGGSALLGFIQSGIGAVARTVQSDMRECLKPTQFGAIEDGTYHQLSERFSTLAAAQAVYPFVTSLADSIDWAAMQACVNAAILAGKAVYHPAGGNALLTSTVTHTGWCDHFGPGTITVGSDLFPAFTIAINTTTVNKPQLVGPKFVGPATTNVLSAALRFTGDDTAFFQHGLFDFSCDGFACVVKDEKTARTTVTGEEAMLNWNVWRIKALNQGVAGYWSTQGSGTGNEFHINGLTLYAGAPILLFEGAGCVVGDIIASGHWGCQVAGGIGLKIGADTVYRAQIALGGVQFDANCDIPLSFSGTGATEYTNINLSGNNLGGATNLGGSLQPASRCVIEDRHYDERVGGVFIASDTVGAETTDCFLVTMASLGTMIVELQAHGLISGVGALSSSALFHVNENGAGVLSGTPIGTPYETVAGQMAWSFANLGGRQGEFRLTYTPTAAGTNITGLYRASGQGHLEKRMIIN